MLLCCREEDGRDERWPAEARDVGQTINDVESCRPGLVAGICRRAVLDVLWASVQNELAHTFGEAFAVEDESVQKLSTGQRHQHPASYPVRLSFLSPYTLFFGSVVCKFK